MLSKKLSTNFTKIISLNSLGERTFHHGISVLCCYDPDGVILKFIKGEISEFLIIQTLQQQHTKKSSFRLFVWLVCWTGNFFSSHTLCRLSHELPL